MTGPTTRRGLIGAAVAGVALGGAAPFVLPDHPDAALLALCSQGLLLEADYGRLCWSTDDFDERHKTHDGEAAKIAFASVCDRHEAVLNQIADTPATTCDGLRSKAKVVLAFFGPALPEEGLPIGDVLGSLLRDAAEWRA